MEVPSLVRNALGGEEIEASVNLGDEDTVYLTGSRTLLYRAEGLLSDEKVEEYTHDVERLDVKEGRRKAKFILEYVDGTETFTVPSTRDDQVLELLLTGVLRAAGVTGADETLAGVFRFSELALIVTETSVVKHIGADVWTADFEVYAFSDLTHLSFDRGSVATEMVLEIDGHPKRIKTPNEDARKVQQVVEGAVFQYYGVSSLDQLNSEIATNDDTADDTTGGSAGDGSSDIEIGDGIDPLVTDSEESDDDTEQSTATQPTTSRDQSRSRSAKSGGEASGAETTNATASRSSTETSTSSTRATESPSESTGQSTGTASSKADVAAMQEQLDELTAVVERQNELLASQQETIDTLIAELREGRG